MFILTETVIQAYLLYIYAKFGGSKYILTDRGGEFTSAEMKELPNELGSFLSHLPSTILFGRTAKYVNDPQNIKL